MKTNSVPARSRSLAVHGLTCLALSCLPLACSSGGDPADEAEPGQLSGNGNGPDFGVEDGDPGFDVDGSQACIGQTAGAESSPTVLQLVVDTSGSMDNDAPGRRATRWTVTRQAWLEAIGRLPADTSVGVVFYPDLPIEAAPRCFDEQADVSIEPLGRAGSAQRQRIGQAFQTQQPDGGTPTHDAYRYAFDQIESTAAAGRRFLVVITDGVPTFSLGCEGTGFVRDPVDPSPLVAEAARASARGVSTFVIGSPGSEGARQSLSRMAEAGGTGLDGCSADGPNFCHFDMTETQDFATELSEALGTIAGLALSCDYDIPAPPGGATLDPARVNVLFTPGGGERELIGQSPAGACAEGWQYSEDGGQIQLCRSTCDRVRGSDGSLELQFGCATRVR